MHPFERWRRDRFGATPPVGYCLRDDHAARWFRLHALPAAKRYAETPAERAEILARAAAAAAALLADGPVWLVHCRFEDGFVPPGVDAIPASPFELAGQYKDGRFEGTLTAYAAQTTWPHADFASIMEQIADDRARAVWFAARTGEAFAPYDGGFDLIAATPQRARDLQRRFPADWFSAPIA